MRCFVAIELPTGIRDRLGDLQGRMQSLGRGIRWARPESIHLTLKFLGEVPDGQVAEVCTIARRVAERCPASELEVAGVGCFPPRGAARVVWVGVLQPPPALLECQRECEAAYAEIGFAPEGRAFSPHLTLGRVNDPAAGYRIRGELGEFESYAAGRFVADELTVFQSELRPSGSVYTPVARGPFKST
jgi:RNA 2',3'-cyclic 3'-phosphodiesterase